MVYICALPTSSTIVLGVSVPGLLSSTVRCFYIIIFILDNNSMLLLPCLKMYYNNVFVFAVFLVSLHGD